MKRLLSTLVLLGAISASARADAEVGQPAPDFTTKDIQGKVHELADYRGQLVVIEAYNLDCPFCAHHYKTGAMQKLQAYATSKGAAWLVVNSVHRNHPSYRSPEAARQEWAAQKIKATAWLDDHAGTLGKAYGLRTTPHLVVIDREGRVAYNGAIDDHPESSGDPGQARNYVREALDDLLAKRPVDPARTKPYGCSVKYAP